MGKSYEFCETYFCNTCMLKEYAKTVPKVF